MIKPTDIDSDTHSERNLISYVMKSKGKHYKWSFQTTQKLIVQSLCLFEFKFMLDSVRRPIHKGVPIHNESCIIFNFERENTYRFQNSFYLIFLCDDFKGSKRFFDHDSLQSHICCISWRYHLDHGSMEIRSQNFHFPWLLIHIKFQQGIDILNP